MRDYEIPEEFDHIQAVLRFGATKHGADNWLTNAGSKSSFKAMHDSMFHHLADSYADGIRYDEGGQSCRGDAETGLDSLLHLACRALMMYTRIRRRIMHPDDVNPEREEILSEVYGNKFGKSEEIGEG